MGRIGDDHRRSGHRLEHAFARAVEPDRAEARLEQTVPFGLLDLLLDLLTAHPLSAQPMEARPDNVRRSDDERRRHAGRDQADGEIEDPLGQAAHVVEHRIDEHDALPVQHDGDDADDGGELDHALEEFRQAAKPVDSGKPAANGKTGKIGHDPVDHEARRVLSGGGDDSGDNEQSENRRQKHQRVEQHQISEGDRVAASVEAPAGGIVDKVDERAGEAAGRFAEEKGHDDEHRSERGEQRHFARRRHDAALDRIGEPLLCRLLGLTFFVDFFGHIGLESLIYAASSPSDAPISISPRCAMPSTISAIARRALAMSRCETEAPFASSLSTRRRAREAIDDSTVSRKAVSVPRSAATIVSVCRLSNRSARARLERLGRSSNVNSIFLRIAASLGCVSLIVWRTSSTAFGSSRLTMSAMRARLSLPAERAALLSRSSCSAASTILSASFETSAGAIMRIRSSLRRSRGNCVTTLAAEAGFTLERMKAAVCGCSFSIKAANAASGAAASLSQRLEFELPRTSERMSAASSGGNAPVSNCSASLALPRRSAPAVKHSVNSSTSLSSASLDMAPRWTAARVTWRSSN